MELLKIDNERGQFLDEAGNFQPIDKITKEDLLRLVNVALEEEVMFDVYNEEKNTKGMHHKKLLNCTVKRLILCQCLELA